MAFTAWQGRPPCSAPLSRGVAYHRFAGANHWRAELRWRMWSSRGSSAEI